MLDLRDNPGGLLGRRSRGGPAPGAQRPHCRTARQDAGRQVVAGSRETEPIPVVVLVNERSASASEIVAGAVRDYGVGILVGKRTHGKGSIQQVIPLGEELGAIRLTIAEYYTPSGTAISGEGLAPDIEVRDDAVPPPRLEYKSRESARVPSAWMYWRSRRPWHLPRALQGTKPTAFSGPAPNKP
ncbi:MAG: S41 family peptidase [Bacillota bacterium]